MAESVSTNAVKLTVAQRDALVVLDRRDGEWVRASKRKSAYREDGPKLSNVNNKAAHALVRQKLVDWQMPSDAIRELPSSVFVCNDKYRINAAGREVLARG